MTIDKDRRRAMLSWLVVSALFLLCGVLGLLQYRWTGDVSVAAREHLGQILQRSLNQLSQDLNVEIAAACQALLPVSPPPDAESLQAEFITRFRQWKRTTRHGNLFRRIAVASLDDDASTLQGVDLERGSLASMAWPEDWAHLKQRFNFRLSGGRAGGFMVAGGFTVAGRFVSGQPPPGPPPDAVVFRSDEDLVFEVPILPAPFPDGQPNLFTRRIAGWVIFELNPDYIRDALLPELVQTHLGSGGSLDYQVEVVGRTTPSAVIWRSDPQQKQSIAPTADASVGLLEPRLDLGFRISTQGGPRRGPDVMEVSGPGRGPGRGPGTGLGRWQMFVRHRSGSLEAVVARTRFRNLAVTAGVLLLILASVAALIRFTGSAQKLAALQMDFVAGVSHELRTPLTVINTAGYNLRGRIAHNPAQVERYGELIQQESGRLKELVEQVLDFASAKAGRVIHDRESVTIESLIEQTVESNRAAVQQAGGVIEKTIDPSLPPVFADPLALQHAIGNLVSNAAKYGMEGSNWIGISARQIDFRNQVMVEIKVADRGPGIPEDEQRRVFDPFFRGRRAVQDQVHGTGLGLNLVKRIVEAHGGSIEMKSTAMKGTEFTVRIPAMLPEHEDEFAHTVDRG